MIEEADNENVNDYLKEKPHWVISNGISLILGLISLSAIISVFVEIDEHYELNIQLEAEGLTGQINNSDDHYLSNISFNNGDLVSKNDFLFNVILVSSEGDVSNFREKLASQLTTNRAQFINQFNAQVPFVDSAVYAPATGMFGYNAKTRRAFIIPNEPSLKGELKLDGIVKKALETSDELTVILESGEVIVARTVNRHLLNEDAVSVNLEFSIPRPLSMEETENQILIVALVLRKTIWSSIIEKM